MPRKTSVIEPRILEHAILLFGDQGYGVSTRDIAASASVTEASIYRIFDTKERLYQLAIKNVGERAQQQMGQVLLRIAQLPQSNPKKQIAETVRGWYDMLSRADARILQQVLKQATPYDKKARDLAWAPLGQIIAIVSGLQNKYKTKTAKAALNAQLLVWALFQHKVLQASPQPTKEENQKIQALIENWIDLVQS
ncbi:MAG TPA: TetR/AcrR family transcriptional regulator [Candidatus Angelobacter sp.]|jgi:AcrR family transcriptional regulator|nr:TetR/AcrR family transcriptional regulator [Candidatus Angelobacter sp.]